MKVSRIGVLTVWVVMLHMCGFANAAGETFGIVAATLKGASPLAPIQDVGKEAYIPGAPLFGVEVKQLDGVNVLQVARMRTCSIDNPGKVFTVGAPGVSFEVSGTSDMENLRTFVGARFASMDNVTSAKVKLTNGRSMYAPPQVLRENFGKAIRGAQCDAGSGKTRAIVRAYFHDVELELAGRNLTLKQASTLVSRGDPPPQVSSTGRVLLVLPRRLVAIQTDFFY